MNRKIAFTIAATAAAISLSACNTPGTASPRLASEHVPTVTQTVMTHDMGYAAGGGFSRADMQEFSEWLDSVDARYGDRISIDDANPAGQALRAATISREIGSRGLMLKAEGPVTAPDVTNGVARVVLVRAVASVPECPDHRRKSNPEYGASKTSNYGCSLTSNIAAMIADPNDFISGKAHGGTDAERAAVAGANHRGKIGNDRVNSSVGSAN
ncbi:MAG: CpaD family pilus assembly lipoprotein [Pacificimonas sp.]